MNVTVEAWEAADAAKGPNESFSDLLMRTFRRPSLRDLAGLLSDGEAEELLANIDDARTASIAASQRRRQELGWP